MKRYQTLVADNARWSGFELRSGDIIISTPPKCGTTWTQMLCALLIFDGPMFPGPLEQLSPWLDNQSRSTDDIRAVYAAQSHRRFIKTHTPLDGLPMCDDVTYIVVGRDPRDAAISMEHHIANFNLERFMELRAAAVGLVSCVGSPLMISASQRRHLARPHDEGIPAAVFRGGERSQGRRWPLKSRRTSDSGH